MRDDAVTTPVLFIKKMAGVALLILGVLLIMLAYSSDSNRLAIPGAVVLLGGLALLVLKIFRRNPS